MRYFKMEGDDATVALCEIGTTSGGAGQRVRLLSRQTIELLPGEPQGDDIGFAEPMKRRVRTVERDKSHKSPAPRSDGIIPRRRTACEMDASVKDEIEVSLSWPSRMMNRSAEIDNDPRCRHRRDDREAQQQPRDSFVAV